MDRDAKVTGLKRLQGLIWEGGYRDGTSRSHVFDEVPMVLKVWQQEGIGLAIYWSGSVAVQKLYSDRDTGRPALVRKRGTGPVR